MITEKQADQNFDSLMTRIDDLTDTEFKHNVLLDCIHDNLTHEDQRNLWKTWIEECALRRRESIKIIRK
jgi:hypothetical protein